jgi:hypothetical protein
LEIKRLPLRATLILALALAGTACKGRNDRVTVQNEEEPPTRTMSLIRMGDPKGSPQLLSGFYGVENNAWRWTARTFSVLLRTPPSSASQGAVVTFAFTLPDVTIQKLKNIEITASVNGTKLKSAGYDKAGANIFSADIPPSLLSGDSVKVDFSLDKAVAPDVDRRELGVVANSIGISGK